MAQLPSTVRNDCDVFKYLTIKLKKGDSLSFILSSRKQARLLTSALTQMAYFTLKTFSSKCMCQIFIKTKLNKMGEAIGLNLCQRLLIATFNTVAERFPQDSLTKITKKVQTLCKLVF